jgi:hypothetical protein
MVMRCFSQVDNFPVPVENNPSAMSEVSPVETGTFAQEAANDAFYDSPEMDKGVSGKVLEGEWMGSRESNPSRKRY